MRGFGKWRLSNAPPQPRARHKREQADGNLKLTLRVLVFFAARHGGMSFGIPGEWPKVQSKQNNNKAK